MGLMFSIYFVPFISLPLSEHFILFSQLPRPQCIYKPMHAHGGVECTQTSPLVLPRCTKSQLFFFFGNAHKKIPSELLWNSYTLVMSSAQVREVYIIVIFLICTPAATGNELITNKNAAGTQKMCRLPPGGT